MTINDYQITINDIGLNIPGITSTLWFMCINIALTDGYPKSSSDFDSVKHY